MNVHASVVALGSLGLLIEGPSGSGKTTLALAVIEDSKRRGLFAALVADDQCLVKVAHNRLIAACPIALSGLAEMRGLGVVNRPFLSATVVDWVIRLVEESDVERMPEAIVTTISGVKIPLLMLPARQFAVNLPILSQLIDSGRF